MEVSVLATLSPDVAQDHVSIRLVLAIGLGDIDAANDGGHVIRTHALKGGVKPDKLNDTSINFIDTQTLIVNAEMCHEQPCSRINAA